MLDNPQSKLNQQASQNNQGLNQQTSKPAPISSQPDGTRATPDMNPQLANPEAARLKDPSGEQPDLVNPEEPQGFFAQLKGKIRENSKKRVTAKLSNTGPEQKSADSNSNQPPQAPGTPKPQAPTPKTPKPSVPKMSRPTPVFKTPKMPKMRK